MLRRENLIKRLILLAIALVAVAVAAVGCGDDEAGGEEVVTTSSLTKAAYIKEATEVCTDTEKRIYDEYQSFHPKDKEKARLEAALPEIVIPAIEDQLEEIRGLGAPKGDEKEIEAMLASVQEDVDQGKEEGLKTPSEFLKELDESDKPVRRYGLKLCTFSF